jgi:bifunctional UDP-N-acetylglucosamine pyrophosphorylase/glucosamine-1-phosphate N-acetyltransferase
MVAGTKKPQQISAVILAAGQGKRMRSALPKVLQPLAGKPLLGHVLETTAQLEPAATYVVYGHGGELVRKTCAAETVQWVLQAEQLGTGHAVQQAMPLIPDDHLVLVLYGDVPLITPETLRALLALASPRAVGLLTVMLDDPTGYGRVLRNRRGQVQRIVEQKDATPAQQKLREGNSGVIAAPAKLLKRWLSQLKSNNSQGEYYLTDVIAMAAQDKIAVRPLPAPNLPEVLGVNDKVQLAALEAHYRARRAQQLMLAGVTIIDPTRIDVRGAVSVGRDVTLDVNVVLNGPITLGDNVVVGPNCVLTNVRVGAGTVLKPNCVFDSAEIGQGCELGPFTRIRPGTELADHVHLGNFVEIKKSRIANGSKVNHLSYVGDSEIGTKVNVGAGTITCNYDGANKWLTTIGDHAFIGSGVMLVAPVTVGAGATIGAGSTITKDAPADQLTLERSRQTSLEHWKRPQKQAK